MKDTKLIKIICIVAVIVIAAIIIIGMALYNKGKIKGEDDLPVVPSIIEENIFGDGEIESKAEQQPQETDEMTVVPTMSDVITTNSTWCGTFQLVWNDMKNKVVKKDIVFNPQIAMAANLNKEEFTEEMLSDEYYFKAYGTKTLDLKKEIEEGINKKFNQTSDIIKDFDWSEKSLNDSNNSKMRRYFFYTMLYREFEFLKEFDKLANGEFGEKYQDIEYFGIDSSTSNEVGSQIYVLYYDSQDDFAVVINTKSNDEVIFCKNPTGKNFNEIYHNMNVKAGKYKGNKNFKKIDEFKAPKINLNEKREYIELEGKTFKTADPIYDTGMIEKAIQTIQFELDEKGGKIKSEAAIDANLVSTSIGAEQQEQPRYFYVDDTFAIFLKEGGKEMPYFAGRIEDITKFQ